MDISENKQFGAVAELKVESELIGRGFVVSVPCGDYAGYDLIADNRKGKLLRLQIKSSRKQASGSRGYHVNVGRGKSQKKPYTLKDCDYVVCVIPDSVYVVPIGDLDVCSLMLFPDGNSGKSAPSNYRGRWEQFRNKWELLY